MSSDGETIAGDPGFAAHGEAPQRVVVNAAGGASEEGSEQDLSRPRP